MKERVVDPRGEAGRQRLERPRPVERLEDQQAGDGDAERSAEEPRWEKRVQIGARESWSGTIPRFPKPQKKRALSERVVSESSNSGHEKSILVSASKWSQKQHNRATIDSTGKINPSEL